MAKNKRISNLLMTASDINSVITFGKINTAVNVQFFFYIECQVLQNTLEPTVNCSVICYFQFLKNGWAGLYDGSVCFIMITKKTQRTFYYLLLLGSTQLGIFTIPRKSSLMCPTDIKFFPPFHTSVMVSSFVTR